jgi:hypothetical protein
LDKEMNMTIDAVETGWKRFLDRLKQLWGKLSHGDPATTAANTVVVARDRNDSPGPAAQLDIWEDEGGAPVGRTLALAAGAAPASGVVSWTGPS